MGGIESSAGRIDISVALSYACQVVGVIVDTSRCGEDAFEGRNGAFVKVQARCRVVASAGTVELEGRALQ